MTKIEAYYLHVTEEKMVRHSSQRLSSTEWEIMKIVWQLKSCAARDVYTRAGEKFGWAPTTVRTFLSRLVNKGFLKTKEVGNCLVYKPAKPFLRTLYDAADDLLDKTLAGKAGPLLSYMVSKTELSKEEIDELREMLDKQEQ